MKIKLNDKYRVTSDKYNYILQEKKLPDPNHHFTIKSNEIRWVDVGYYGNIRHLINALLENEIKQSDVTKLEDIILLLRDVRESIVNKIEGDIK
jgi:hypothetical protein